MLLRAAGHDAIAVRDVGLQDEPDDTILDFAIGEDRVIVSNDSDFGTLLAFRRTMKPSFVLIRSADTLTPDEQASLLLFNLALVEEELVAGAIVTFARGRLRIRRLPVT